MCHDYTQKQVDRFWAKVSIQVEDFSCWVWQRNKSGKGYGRVRVNGRDVLAHRMSYTLVFGEIPEGLWVLHHCDNPSCVNPNHLFLGTHLDNMRDMVSKDRHADLQGEDIGSAKIPNMGVIEIRKKYKPRTWGLVKELAIEHGVSRRTIQVIVARRSRKVR